MYQQILNDLGKGDFAAFQLTEKILKIVLKHFFIKSNRAKTRQAHVSDFLLQRIKLEITYFNGMVCLSIK